MVLLWTKKNAPPSVHHHSFFGLSLQRLLKLNRSGEGGRQGARECERKRRSRRKVHFYLLVLEREKEEEKKENEKEGGDQMRVAA